MQVVAEVGHRLHDGGVVAVGRHVGDERLVDLELTDRHPLQLCERRVAHAEVVDAQADSLIVQPVEHRERVLGVGHDRALGDLEGEDLRPEPGQFEMAHHLLDQMLVREAPHRQVHGDVEVEPVTLPLADAFQALLEHQVGEVADEAALLGDRDELVGHDRSVLRMCPASERLDRDHLAGVQVDLGLEVGFDLAALDGVTQVGGE